MAAGCGEKGDTGEDEKDGEDAFVHGGGSGKRVM